ncbi:hypothetical protein JQU17_16615 [Ponticoccus sp. SC2-23]|uniref:hypothetical protein n=1 Tax=Alexandriicola marinus TaxID=2081710 RepID=UPI000FD8375B|nr:hypothetical protein [Alexandriicola marinus]MBM1220980.1 hypothetical protein [Ponticoccus sp. SC6-9]MBM1225550.1 hypothetical protein [Ponticoccus sp. SC6-15]MBM1231887.1 hypothetical protein [Ponticoccus sp. SC6-38]MBM1236392.1 hypothetical protein [Ponticoccus sp. SC6-45]MBM1240909.1 hypothetical protein [Ponticoccus sp. SC6-49]MBM1243473.1 hypothetical protein [Ponticoccus sp. SC2-64]MBM1249892.1 hypothetical protein [Ponticoccus sp. SC6-42]MBM1254382.1 hypothetical protein [Pontico
MTRLALAALIALTPTLAAAWGKENYYSYDSDRSASYTSTSSDKGTSDQQDSDKNGADNVTSGGDAGTETMPTEELFGSYNFDVRH